MNVEIIKCLKDNYSYLVIDNNKNDLSGAIYALNYIKKEYGKKNNK